MSDDESGGAGYKIMAMLASLVGAVIARKLLGVVWKLLSGKEPPENPEHPTVTWPEAATWAIASGAVVGFARLAAQKKVADSFHRAEEHNTPPRGVFTRS